MLNSCELQFAKTINSQNPDQSIEEIAREIDPNNIEDIKKQLRKIYSDYSGHTDSLGIEALHSIFKVRNASGREVLDNRFLIQVKRKINETIVQALFDGRPFTAKDLTIKLKGLCSLAKASLPLNEQWKFVINREEIINSGNVERFSNYLLAFHMPLIVNSWYNKLMIYDPETNQYEFNINTKIRTDWNTDAFEEQEAEINNVLELMLNATQLRDYCAGTNDETAPFIPNIYLTKNSFFYAVSKFAEHIMETSDNIDHYDMFMKDPYYMFEYIKTRKINNSELWVNVLKSFANKWIYRKNQGTWEETNFVLGSKKSGSSTEFNPLQVILTTINKYRPQAYSEIGLDKSNKFTSQILDIDSGFLSSLIAKTAIKLKHTSISELVSKFGNIFVVENNKLTILEGSSVNEKIEFIHWLTESSTSINADSSTLRTAIDGFLSNVVNSKNTGKEFDKVVAADFLSNKKIFLALTRNLPYVKGTTTNALGKQLPVIGISSVTHSIPTEISKLRTKIEKNKAIYAKHEGITAPTTVSEISSLYRTKTADMPKTVYRSTISYRDGELIKDPTELSIPESFKLSFIADFLQAGRNKIRIEAITPSDKKRIPFFEFDLANIYIPGGEPIVNFESCRQAMLNQITDFYKQSLVNTINDIIQVLNIKSIPKVDLTSDLLKAVSDINKYCKNEKITETFLQDCVHQFNTTYGTNKVIANVLDVESVIIDGVKTIQVASAATATVKEMSKSDYWDNIYIHFLTELNKLFPDGLSKKETGLRKDINFAEEIERAKEGKHFGSKLYEYFVYTNFLSENILVNTVGLPLAHKAKGAKEFESINTKSHITMVKRMVAHTATMHACVKGVPSGLPDQVNMMTWAAGSTPIFTYSTNSAGGKRVQDNLDIIDGAIIGVRCVDNLLKQSMADVRPKGNMLKLLMHDLHEEKCASSLVKCAELSIDNAYLRAFGNAENVIVGGMDPTIFMQLSLEQASLQYNTLPKMLDYNIRPSKLENGNVITLKQITISEDGRTLTLAWTGKEDVETIPNDLFSLWQACGGAWSCDKKGVYNESSQDFITYLFNKCISDNEQYLKSQVIHYFPTDTTQKSLQNPVVKNLNAAALGEVSKYVVRMDISRFGIQLDADHASEDSHIREVSQLMSNLAEGNYTPEETNYIYNALGQLVTIMEDKIGIDFEHMTEEDEKRLDKLFGDKILRIFDDPTLDVMGLANTLSAEILEYNKVSGKTIAIPYSDRQFLSKYHTTTGSYFNKFIARKWSGRGDVIVPSHNMAMLYEDLEGNTYLPSDNIGSTGKNIREYLREYVFKSESQSVLFAESDDKNSGVVSLWIEKDGVSAPFTENDFTEEFLGNTSLIVSQHEVRPGENYYRITEDKKVSLVTNVKGLDQLYAISDDIASGAAVYYRAINLPRNLKSKQVGFIDSSGQYHDIFHSNTYKKIWLLDKFIHEPGELTESQKAFINARTVKDAIIEKKQLQSKLERIILPSLKSDVVSEELAAEFDIPANQPMTLVVKNDETIIANNNSHSQGNANWSEINQKGEEYFKERLVSKFNLPVVENLESYSGIFYTSDGNILLTTHTIDNIPTDSIQITPIVDENGYRLDKHGNKMYKVPENAKFYKSGNYDIIITDDISAIEFSNERAFVAYRWFRQLTENANPTKRLVGDASDNLLYTNLASKQYKAWKESNNMISARIPSQSLSFAAALKVVAYTPWHSNTIMVPNSYVYIQGSDFDIDKIYSIMMGLDKTGTMPQLDDLRLESSNLPISEFNSDEQIFNTKLAITLVNSSGSGFVESDVYVLKQLLSNIIYGYTDNSVNISETVCRYNKSLVLQKVISALLSEGYELNDNDLAVLNARFDSLVKRLSDFINTTLVELNQESGIVATQNTILRKMLNVWNDPATVVASSTPTTMRPIKEVIEDKKDLGTATRYHHDPLSTVFINQTTAVGRKGISIAASGQKALLALNYYYSQFGEKSLFKPFEFKIPKDWQSYKTKSGQTKMFGETFINFLYPGAALNEATISDIVSYIVKDKEIVPGNKYTYENCVLEVFDDFNGGIYYKLTITNGDNETEIDLVPGAIMNPDAAYKINSALISSATDNAKEMDLDLINGSPEILPAYIFGLSVGIPMSLLVNIFTDPAITLLINEAKGDIFKGKKKSRVSSLLNNDKIVKDSSKRAILKRLFEGADNLTALASLLSINQGIDVYNGAAMEFQLKFEKTINDSKDTFAPKFNAERFFMASPETRAEIVKMYSKSKDFYNILDIFAVSTHFYQMGKVPFILKRVVENTSKDISLLHQVMAKHGNHYVENPQKTANNVLKVLNHIKILEFLRQLDFEYTPQTIYDQRGNVINSEENTFPISMKNLHGITSFKKYVEDVIFPALKSDPELKGNQFIDNLAMDSIGSSLFYSNIEYLSSKVNLNDLQNIDKVNGIKLDFYNIANKSIGGHTVFEWFFLYDLIVHNHNIGGQSLTQLFDQDIDLYNDNNLITQWVKFIGEYDKWDGPWKVAETDTLADYYKAPDARLLAEMGDDDRDIPTKHHAPGWVSDPSYLPLYVDINTRFGSMRYLHRSQIAQIYANGNLLIYKC